MTQVAKFKLNLRTREVEIEGSEQFVERQIQQLEQLFEFIAGVGDDAEGDGDVGADQVAQGNGSAGLAAKANGSPLPASFGEWLHGFSKDLTDLDKALITARYVQYQSTENDFKTSEINKSLQDHGIKLANASQTLRRLGEKKYLFQTRKVGKLRFMRVSVDGQAHLETLRAAA